LENLEMSGNLTAMSVCDFTESRGNVREKILSGKSCLKLFIVSCIFCPCRYLVGVYSVSNIWFWIIVGI